MARINEKQVADIIKFMQSRNAFPTITRMQYMPVDMEFALSMVETIGKTRNDKFRIDNENRFVYENIIRWIHGDPDFKCLSPDNPNTIVPGVLNRGIYIAGNTGTGKSWCLEILSMYVQCLNIGCMIAGQKHALAWG